MSNNLAKKMENAANEIIALRKLLKERDAEIEHMKAVLERQYGLIDGLKFALRVNGVSGGEVTA